MFFLQPLFSSYSFDLKFKINKISSACCKLPTENCHPESPMTSGKQIYPSYSALPLLQSFYSSLQHSITPKKYYFSSSLYSPVIPSILNLQSKIKSPSACCLQPNLFSNTPVLQHSITPVSLTNTPALQHSITPVSPTITPVLHYSNFNLSSFHLPLLFWARESL